MNTQPRTPRLAYSINEAATALSISRRSVYTMIAEGRLRSVRIGARQRVPVAALDELLSGSGQPAAAPEPAVTTVEAVPPASRPPNRPADDCDDRVRASKLRLSDLLAQMRANR